MAIERLRRHRRRLACGLSAVCFRMRQPLKKMKYTPELYSDFNQFSYKFTDFVDSVLVEIHVFFVRQQNVDIFAAIHQQFQTEQITIGFGAFQFTERVVFGVFMFPCLFPLALFHQFCSWKNRTNTIRAHCYEVKTKSDSPSTGASDKVDQLSSTGSLRMALPESTEVLSETQLYRYSTSAPPCEAKLKYLTANGLGSNAVINGSSLSSVNTRMWPSATENKLLVCSQYTKIIYFHLLKFQWQLWLDASYQSPAWFPNLSASNCLSVFLSVPENFPSLRELKFDDFIRVLLMFSYGLCQQLDLDSTVRGYQHLMTEWTEKRAILLSVSGHRK